MKQNHEVIRTTDVVRSADSTTVPYLVDGYTLERELDRSTGKWINRYRDLESGEVRFTPPVRAKRAARRNASASTASVTRSERYPDSLYDLGETRSAGQPPYNPNDPAWLTYEIGRLEARGLDMSVREQRNLGELKRRRTAIDAAIRDKQYRETMDKAAIARTRLNRDARTIDPFSASADECRSAARTVIDANRYISTARGEALDAMIDEDVRGEESRRILTFGTAAWRSVYHKGLSRDHPNFTPSEYAALGRAQRYDAERGLTIANLFGAPIDVDPTIQEASAERPTLAVLANSVVTDAPVYKAVTAPAPAFTWDGEDSVPDEADPTFSQPVIDIFKITNFFGVSRELFFDEPNFETTYSPMLIRGFGDAIQNAIINGDGTTSPMGLFNTSSGIQTVSVSSAGHLSAVDVRAAWDVIPERFRDDAVWVMHPDVLSQIRADAGAASQVDLLSDRQGVTLMSKRVIESTHCPDYTGTTSGSTQYLAVGSMSAYTLVTRMNLYVERIANMRASASGRPLGQLGWWSTARLGGAPTVPGAFAILTN